VVSETALLSRIERAWQVLRGVLDPEVPVLSVCDLGIVREVIENVGGLTVVVTPTYSGCPATEVIEQSIVDALVAEGLGPVQVEMRRAPAWTTDWISTAGKDSCVNTASCRPGRWQHPAPCRCASCRAGMPHRSPAHAARA
jgi:ring-1,2-phenylacetyl-CoA epoxidase subunit PaaD